MVQAVSEPFIPPRVSVTSVTVAGPSSLWQIPNGSRARVRRGVEITAGGLRYQC